MSLSFLSYYQSMIMCLLFVLPLFGGAAFVPPPVGYIVSLVALISIIISSVRILQGPEKKE